MQSQPHRDRRGTWSWLASIAALLLVACGGSGRDPELLAVADISPRQIELGDRLEIVGDGFPEGRRAKVEFEGVLHRAGDPNVYPLHQTFEAESSGRNLVSFVPQEAQLERWVGEGETAAHTTFRGSLRLAFAAHKARTGPVYGTLDDVVIDVFPWGVPRQLREARAEEAARFARFVGLTLERGKFEVTLVKPGSRAERAGVRGGDELRALDGVNLKALSDFQPGGAGTTARLTLKRGRLAEPLELDLPVEGFRPLSPTRLKEAALLVAFVAALLLLSCAPVIRVLIWTERRIALSWLELCTRPRRAGPRLRPSLYETLFSRDLLPGGLAGVLFRPVPYIIFAAASTVFALLALGKSFVAAAWDIPLSFLASVVAMVCAASLLGGWRGSGRWSLVSGMRAAGSALAFQVPAGLALFGVFVHEGTLRASSLVAQQGLWPWQYHVFKSPMLFVACLVLLATCVPDSSRSGHQSSLRMHPDEPLDHRGSRSLVFFAELTHVFIVCNIAAALFFGGWALAPGQALSEGLGGAALLQLKSLILVLCVFGTRWATGCAARRQLSGFWLRRLLPLTLATLGCSALYQRSLGRFPLLRESQAELSWVVFSLVAVLMAYSGVRVVRAVQRGNLKLSSYSLNPWL